MEDETELRDAIDDKLKEIKEPSKPTEPKELKPEDKPIESTDKRSKDKKIRIVAVISILIITTIAILGIFILIDWDGDGLYNLSEINHGTSFLNSDSDNDGLNDYEEIYEYYLDPLDPDWDSDFVSDGDEILILGTNPKNEDTDNDGYDDFWDDHPTEHEWKYSDSDGDGWSDYKEYYEEDTDMYKSDTDGDGYLDSADPHPTVHEWKYKDSDGDGWSDYKEYYETGTNILSSDTDGDGALDPKDADPLNPSYDITRNFEWDYPHDWWNKRTWTWSLSLSRDLYTYMKQLPRLNSYSDWSEYTVDPVITTLANGLKEATEKEGFDDYQTVSFILAFVQSLPYTSDDVTTGADNYPRYPIETLVDEGGDCEDTSFLFAGIIKELDYGVCLISPPGHVAVGVLGSDTLSGTYYELDGKRYYYCETTGSGYEIGDCPDEFKNESAKLIKL